METNLEKVKIALCENDIEFGEDESREELLEKFYSLPITQAQKEELYHYGIAYKESWSWNRRAAISFLKDIKDYNELLRKLPVSPQQKAILLSHDYCDFEGLTSGQAADIIFNLPPEQEQLNYINMFKLEVPKGVELTYGIAESIIRKHKEKLFRNL